MTRLLRSTRRALRGPPGRPGRLGRDRSRACFGKPRPPRPLAVSAARAEIWLTDFGEPVGREQAGRRPGVIVSADRLNESPAGAVIAVPCTSSARGLPSHVELDRARSGLDEVSYAKCEDVQSISEHRLVARLGEADSGSMFEISRTLAYLFDL